MENEIVDGETTNNSDVPEFATKPTPEATPVETPEEPKAKPETDASELEAKNRQLFERAKTAEKKAKDAQDEVERLKKVPKTDSTLNVEDYIDISASLEGLDKREKEKLASEHKLTGKSLTEIRSSEDFILWQTAYREKVAKEKALNPSTRQTEAEKPKALEDKFEELKGGSHFRITPEAEELMEKEGLWKNPSNVKFKA